MSSLLVINSGSSSIKYQLFDMESETVLAKGLIERIGSDRGIVTHTGPNGTERVERSLADHTAGLQAMIDAGAEWGPDLANAAIAGVGHRVVQGGSRFVEPTLIDDEVVRTIDELSALAPLHNPPNLLGIQAARAAFPDVPHIAVFDTAFHQGIPEMAYTYAIDAGIARAHGVRRYGFHGTSHKYVSEQAATFLGIPYRELRAIVLHLGNGASACAIRDGRSVDTSMGLTPLEGLVMGTRSGDLDPGIIFHLHREAGMAIDEIDHLLNRRSGLLGVAGSGDMRDVLDRATQGDRAAGLALDIYCRRIRHYVGAYLAELGGLDAIVFTAGVGENAVEVRRRSLAGLDHLGIEIDTDRNTSGERGTRAISTDASKVAVLVVPTNEELEIARQTLRAIRG